MNLGIGVDIENISKFGNLKQSTDTKFLDKIFTKFELEYCFKKKIPAQHLAVRFAAKEATIKAINSRYSNSLALTDIEIRNDFKRKPLVHIKKEGYEHMKFLLSLSHNDDNAIAFVIIEKNGELD